MASNNRSTSARLSVFGSARAVPGRGSDAPASSLRKPSSARKAKNRRNAADLREVARFVPLDRILIETDSTYLAPVPYRGKTNNPSYLPHVARQIAELKGLEVEAVAEATSRNFELLFDRAA